MGEMLNLDFTGVETGFKLPEDDYLFRVEDLELKPSKAGDSNVLKVTCVVAEGEKEGKKLTTWFSLKQEALWNLKLWLEAITGEPQEGALSLDMDALLGVEFIGTVRDTEDGKYSQIVTYTHPD